MVGAAPGEDSATYFLVRGSPTTLAGTVHLQRVYINAVLPDVMVPLLSRCCGQLEKRELMNGTTKDKTTEWWLSLIKDECDKFLERRGALPGLTTVRRAVVPSVRLC